MGDGRPPAWPEFMSMMALHERWSSIFAGRTRSLIHPGVSLWAVAQRPLIREGGGTRVCIALRVIPYAAPAPAGRDTPEFSIAAFPFSPPTGILAYRR